MRNKRGRIKIRLEVIYRERNLHIRAYAEPGSNADGASVKADNFFRKGETDAVTAEPAGVLTPEEWLKKM
jgi:hypothetical protein